MQRVSSGARRRHASGSVVTCGQCHSQRAWTPATFDHESLFSLTGDHEASCNICHVGKDYRTYTCYGCHEHTRSEIREKHVEEGIADYENCIECHRNGKAEEDEHEGRRRDGQTRAGGSDGEPDGKSNDKKESEEHDD